MHACLHVLPLFHTKVTPLEISEKNSSSSTLMILGGNGRNYYQPSFKAEESCNHGVKNAQKLLRMENFLEYYPTVCESVNFH